MRAPISLVVVVLVSCAACGGAPKRDPDPVPAPKQTELQVRQDAACDKAGPRIIGCAMDDLKASTSPEELAKLDLDKMRAANIDKFATTCKGGYMSSRQVRVYEVCVAQETECEPLISCLDNANPQK